MAELAHELRTTGNTDTEACDMSIARREDEPQTVEPEVQKMAVTSPAKPETRVSPPQRPVTRSQTGRVAKRRRPDDSPSPEVSKRGARASKKTNASKIPEKSPNSDISKADEAPKASHREDPLAPSDDTSPFKSTQSAALGGPSSSAMSSLDVDLPGSKFRATLPIPVPNLTKKSRGRRVPTKLPNDDNVDPKGTRMYVCKVESCGKCFHRGEHLKRHIRSIHTHEKPFKCTFEQCNKHFNRHDNLLQHLKVHKELASSESSAADDRGSPVQVVRQCTPPPAPPSVGTPPQLQPYYPDYTAHEAHEPASVQARTMLYQPPTSAFRAYATSYGSISEPASLATNMAVSSLRTEIPQSPPDSRPVKAL